MSFPTRNISDTNLALPVLGFGTAHLGELYKKLDDASVMDSLNKAKESGISYFDTAPWYGRGMAETRLGNFLSNNKDQNFIVSTKVGRILKPASNPDSFDRSPWLGGFTNEVIFDYSYEGVMKSFEQSIKRLQLNKIDALIIHDLDELYHSSEFDRHEESLFEGGIQALKDLKSDGRIKAYGMGINTNKGFDYWAGRIDLDFFLVAMPYTLLEQVSLHGGMKTCLEKGINVVIGSPFASGVLATGSHKNAKYDYSTITSDMLDKVKKIESLCHSHGISLGSAALKFPLAHPAVVSVIPGMTSKAEVEQNISCFSENIPASFWMDMKAEKIITDGAPIPV